MDPNVSDSDEGTEDASCSTRTGAAGSPPRASHDGGVDRASPDLDLAPPRAPPRAAGKRKPDPSRAPLRAGQRPKTEPVADAREGADGTAPPALDARLAAARAMARSAIVAGSSEISADASDDASLSKDASASDASAETAKPATPSPAASPAATANAARGAPATFLTPGPARRTPSDGSDAACDFGARVPADTAASIAGVLECLADEGDLSDGSRGGYLDDDAADLDDRLNTHGPSGLLATPLLRHQKRAVAWMRRREAAGSSPRGGLLADDQGLGKTFSAIALMVANPPPTRWRESGGGGTLVVCPTSVLRQWRRELASKVRASAGLRVLVHHGVGRTKLAADLARYDVVLTTFAVVALETNPAAAPDDDAGSGGGGVATKSGGGAVGATEWFRVILDEAQSVKNARSQVATAVRAVRAQRRWCLSGTPLQNNVDDLFSYFRFLRYEPYGDASAFRAMIKEPIRVDPASGFRALRTILRAVTLRRTKQSTINGEPIVRLPPRTVAHARLTFDAPEAEKYARLQAEYRAKMEEFAAAGTVASNYVNLLHMLLRLRQACNHPALGAGCAGDGFVDGNGNGNGNGNPSEVSSARSRRAASVPGAAAVSAARRLPAELRGLMRAAAEDGASVCGVCGDAPENPAVASCCARAFCGDCVSARPACASCGEALTRARVHTVAALDAAERFFVSADEERRGNRRENPRDPRDPEADAASERRPHSAAARESRRAGLGPRGAAASAGPGWRLTRPADDALSTGDGRVGGDFAARGWPSASGGDGIVERGGGERAAAAAAGGPEGPGASPGLSPAAGTKARGIMEYLVALRAKHREAREARAAAERSAASAARSKPVVRGHRASLTGAGANAASLAAVAKGTQLRRGIRSSDAALCAALPPVSSPAAVRASADRDRGGSKRRGTAGGGAFSLSSSSVAKGRSASPPPEKAIVFSQWTAMLDLLEPRLREAGIPFRRLDGTMSLAARERALSEFEEKPDVTVILMSLKAAGLGVNLTCANHVILSDVWWNPTVEEQAIDRAHRIGQTREVKVVRFTVRGTVEDRILALQDRKRAMVAAAFGEDAEGCANRAQLSMEDLVFLFGSGTNAGGGDGGARGDV